MSDGINSQLKVLQSLGAELVETIDPAYPDDPAIPNMAFRFNDALAEILPFHMPEIFAWKKDGKAQFTLDGLGRHQPQIPRGALGAQGAAAGRHELPHACSPTRRTTKAVTGYTFAFQFAQYLALRGDSRVFDWKTLNANAKYFNDAAPRGDEELGEQGHRHAHQRHRLHHASAATRCAWS